MLGQRKRRWADDVQMAHPLSVPRRGTKHNTVTQYLAMVGERHRRWPTISPALGQRIGNSQHRRLTALTSLPCVLRNDIA